MNTQSIIGIILIVTGAGLLAYGGFTTTNREDIINVGPLKVQADVTERHRIPPAVSLITIAAGLVVFAIGLKKK